MKRRLPAIAALLVACSLASPATAGQRLYDEYCVYVAQYTFCTPPQPF